jgi:hypothetical protein
LSKVERTSGYRSMDWLLEHVETLQCSRRCSSRSRACSSSMTADAAQIAGGYKALLEVERGWRDLKPTSAAGLPPHGRAHHRPRTAVPAGVAADPNRRDRLGDTWRNLSAKLDRMQLHTFVTGQAPSPDAPG